MSKCLLYIRKEENEDEEESTIPMSQKVPSLLHSQLCFLILLLNTKIAHKKPKFEIFSCLSTFVRVVKEEGLRSSGRQTAWVRTPQGAFFIFLLFFIDEINRTPQGAFFVFLFI